MNNGITSRFYLQSIRINRTIRCFSVRLLSTGLRRPRQFKSMYIGGDMPPSDRMEPYAHGEKSTEEYLKKTSLSPWAPLSDAAARKIFDMAKACPEDVHVDLGCGDGRVNFHAVTYGVGRSIGVDIDENIVEVARNRLAKRHPRPTNIEFLVADLMNESEPAWEKVQQGSIITMYFATEALERFRPVLERKLVGRKCQVITCGYDMPGWDTNIQEVILGMQINLYRWGSETEDGSAEAIFIGEDILPRRPLELSRTNPNFAGAKVIDRTNRYPIKGFDPSIFSEVEDDDDDWFSDEEEEKTDENRANDKK